MYRGPSRKGGNKDTSSVVSDRLPRFLQRGGRRKRSLGPWEGGGGVRWFQGTSFHYRKETKEKLVRKNRPFVCGAILSFLASCSPLAYFKWQKPAHPRERISPPPCPESTPLPLTSNPLSLLLLLLLATNRLTPAIISLENDALNFNCLYFEKRKTSLTNRPLEIVPRANGEDPSSRFFFKAVSSRSCLSFKAERYQAQISAPLLREDKGSVKKKNKVGYKVEKWYIFFKRVSFGEGGRIENSTNKIYTFFIIYNRNLYCKNDVDLCRPNLCRFNLSSIVEQCKKKSSKAPGRFELPISCLLDRRFNQLSHGAFCVLCFIPKSLFVKVFYDSSSGWTKYRYDFLTL